MKSGSGSPLGYNPWDFSLMQPNDFRFIETNTKSISKVSGKNHKYKDVSFFW